MEQADREFVRRFGLNLRRARKELHLSQEEIAERAGITNKYLSEIENGKRSVRLAVAHRLSDAVGKTLDQLSSGERSGKAPRPYEMDPRMNDLLRRLETAEKRRAYGILKAAFKG